MYFSEKMTARKPITLITTSIIELRPSETSRIPKGGFQFPTVYMNGASNSIRTAMKASRPVTRNAMTSAALRVIFARSSVRNVAASGMAVNNG